MDLEKHMTEIVLCIVCIVYVGIVCVGGEEEEDEDRGSEGHLQKQS